jgi:polar amino acid transport system permease protein
MAASFDWNAFFSSLGQMLPGMSVTIQLAVLSMAGGLVLGLPLALMRLYGPAPVRGLSAVWTRVWISTPLLLQLFWLYYVLPATTGILLPGLTLAILGLAFQMSAFLSEAFRAGIGSIRQGQWNAGMALGMGRWQVLRYIILRQAISRVLPSIANIWVFLFKITSVASVIGVADLTFHALVLRQETFRTMEVLTGLAVLYLVLAYPQTKIADLLHRRSEVHE